MGEGGPDGGEDRRAAGAPGRGGAVPDAAPVLRRAVRFGGPRPTVPVADGEPGVECQIDFAYLGMLPDPVTGRRRMVHALIFTAVYSRHMFVWLTFSQTLAAVIAGCEAAWEFFGGVFKVLVPRQRRRLSPMLTGEPAVHRRVAGVRPGPRSRHRPARVRSPKDKPRVERACSTCAGTSSPARSSASWPMRRPAPRRGAPVTAGMRIHGTIRARPAEVFAEHEARLLLPAPAAYDVPILRGSKCTATTMSRSARPSTRRRTVSGPHRTPAPTPSW